MARKKDVVKKIDIKTKASGAPLPLIQEDQIAPPAFYVIPAPDSLREVSQAIQRSTQAPLVMVAIAWNEAPNIAPDYYNVEYSENADFSDSQRRRANTLSATIEGLKANDYTYYFRVQAVAGGIYSEWSNTLTVNTITDDTPPPDVTGASAAFQNSDLVITYVIPTSEILKDVQIDIYNAARTVHYGTFYTASQRFVWTAEQNIFATGGVPLTQVSVDIHTRSWTNQPSVPGLTITATAPLPSTPIGYTSNWISDNGTAHADFITSWLGAANANDYELTIDGKNYYTRDLKFVYSYEQNVADHAPTLPSGDPSFIWLLKARDKLGQSSVPVNVIVTNAAPPSGVMNLTVNPGFATLGATVGLLASTIVQDFDHYEWRVWNGTTFVRTINTPDPSVIFDLSSDGPGTYTPSVTMVDKFNQRSTTVSGAPQVLDVLTIDQLRAETQYTDWLGTSSSILNRLKDGVLYDGSGNYVSYAANAGWQWIQASRPLLDRYKTLTFSGFWSSTFSFYFQVDTPSGIVYYAGPITISANGSYLMTRYTSQATAQTNAYVFGLAGNGTKRFDFTQIEESRNIRLWFKDTVSLNGIYEFYPRRLVQSDDIEAESIRSINIAAGGINADRITTINLQALSANMGSLHIDSLLDIATNGIIFQGTGSGTLVQNAVTPTSFSVTGLKIYQVSGVGRLATYNSGVEQIALDTDGRFKAGAGSVILDATGIQFLSNATNATNRRINFTNGIGGSTVAYIDSDYSTLGTNTFEIRASQGSSSDNVNATITARTVTGTVTSAVTVKRGLASIIGLQVEASASASKIGLTGANAYADIGFSIGSSNAPTRNLSIFADNGYISWNNAAGTEKWVAGLETSGSGRWVLYSAVAGNYAINVASNMDIVFNGASVTTAGNFATNAITGTVITLAGNGSSVNIRNNSGTNLRNYVNFMNSSGGILWQISPDLNSNGTNDLYFHDGVNGQTRLQIGPGGNIGIQQKLYIGAIGVTPTALIHLASDSALKPTTTTWQTTSTKDAKENIKTRKGALARIKQLRLTDYEYNGKFNTEKGKKGVGFIAEETIQVYPDTVEELSYMDENGIEQRFLAFNPHEIFMDYAVAIQELTAEVELLKSKGK